MQEKLENTIPSWGPKTTRPLYFLFIRHDIPCTSRGKKEFITISSYYLSFVGHIMSIFVSCKLERNVQHNKCYFTMLDRE